MKKIASLLLLGLLAVLLGGSVGAVAAGFLHFIEWAQHLLWEVISVNLPWQALFVCTLGGLLVGLCQRFLGDHPKGIQEAVVEIRQTGRLDYVHLPQGMTTASVSLIFGASLGPESAIMDLLGGLSTWVGDVLRSIRENLNQAQVSESGSRLVRLTNAWPNGLAFLVGALAFGRSLNGLYSGGLLHFTYVFQWMDLLWSIPLGLLGAGAGLLYTFLQKQTERWVEPLKDHPIRRSLLGGFVLGLAALFLPQVLFSGQHALQPAYDQALQLGFWSLLFIGLARLLLTALLLSTGWKGGQFLPIMFAAATLGLAMSVPFPAVPAPVAVLAAMAALIAVVLPKPLIALVLMGLLFPLNTLGISLVGVGVVVFGKRLWLRTVQPAQQSRPASAASD